jgi:hypothetical protein
VEHLAGAHSIGRLLALHLNIRLARLKHTSLFYGASVMKKRSLIAIFKNFSSLLLMEQNKLECSSLADILRLA